MQWPRITRGDEYLRTLFCCTFILSGSNVKDYANCWLYYISEFIGYNKQCKLKPDITSENHNVTLKARAEAIGGWNEKNRYIVKHSN